MRDQHCVRFEVLIRQKKLKKKDAYGTLHSHAVTHHTTTKAQQRLASEIGRDQAFSLWFDCKRRKKEILTY